MKDRTLDQDSKYDLRRWSNQLRSLNELISTCGTDDKTDPERR